MPGHDIIAIGASAGGIESLRTLVTLLPAGLPASIFVVVHIPPGVPSLLPEILERVGNLPALSPTDKMAIEHGRIYVAPTDRHLILEPGQVRIVSGPKENRCRPAIDPLFRSAAWVYGPRVVGVVLSGSLDDGTAGLWAVKASGGVAVVQDPAEALFSDMPDNALRNVTVDHCLPINDIAALLIDLTARQASAAPAYPPKTIEREIESTEMKKHIKDMDQFGKPSPLTCPSCHGALWERSEGEPMRYRCHTGHGFSPESLVAEQSEAIEQALFSSLRALEEKAATLRRLAAHYRKLPDLRSRYERRAQEADNSAATVRQLLGAGKEN